MEFGMPNENRQRLQRLFYRELMQRHYNYGRVRNERIGIWQEEDALLLSNHVPQQIEDLLVNYGIERSTKKVQKELVW